MTIKAKYIWWGIGGTTFWGLIFYFVGHVTIGRPVTQIAVPYAILVALLWVLQMIMYRSERIAEYEARVRRRMEIYTFSLLLLWSILLVWLVVGNSMHWILALFCWFIGMVIALGSAWVVYKSALKQQPRRQPNDK